MGFTCNGFNINWLRFDQDNLKSHEEHMLEAEELCQAIDFASTSRAAWRIF